MLIFPPCSLRSILILLSHLRLGFPMTTFSGCTYKNYACNISLRRRACYIPSSSLSFSLIWAFEYLMARNTNTAFSILLQPPLSYAQIFSLYITLHYTVILLATEPSRIRGKSHHFLLELSYNFLCFIPYSFPILHVIEWYVEAEAKSHLPRITLRNTQT
jgi:hypothetical protein